MAKKQRARRRRRNVGRRGNVVPRDRKLMEALKLFVRKKAVRFLDDPNITSVGVGYKIKGGKETNEICVQFTVRKKRALGPELEALKTAEIPRTFKVGKHEIPSDVIERVYHSSLRLVTEKEHVKDTRKQRLAVLVPGISVGHTSTTAGTLGAIVYDARDGQPLVLSNWHVLHTPEGKIGDAMLQPGPFDDNRVNENRAGTLLRSHLGLAGDCAVASIEGRGIDPTVLDLKTKISQVARPELRDRVIKSGRTTGVTYGVVRRVDTIVKIDYGNGIGEQRIGGFEIGPDEKRRARNNEISMGGDSGSVWLGARNDGRATDIMVGLHFAGEGRGDPDEHAIACYAHSVLEKLEISLQEPAVSPQAVAELQPAGFDPHFLTSGVAFPKLKAQVAADAVKLQGSHLVAYTHFTVCLSRSRRMARFVAWNIDGDRIRKLSVGGRLKTSHGRSGQNRPGLRSIDTINSTFCQRDL